MPEMELLEFRVAEPPEEFAAAFAEHEVMRLLRRYVVTRKPLAIADILMHPMAKAIPWEVAERHDTYTIFGEFLRTPQRRHHRQTAREPSPQRARADRRRHRVRSLPSLQQ